jgi:hypothetical protein
MARVLTYHAARSTKPGTTDQKASVKNTPALGDKLQLLAFAMPQALTTIERLVDTLIDRLPPSHVA